MAKEVKGFRYIYQAGLFLIALLVFPYVFNAKLDLNGDNCYYYINATSLASGNGYCDMFGEPTANFPPGYPLLMAPLRAVTSSFVAQKILNLLFLFGGVILLFSVLVREGVRRELSFIAAAAVLVTPHLLEFSTMMMSEASCFFFIILAFWSFLRVPSEPGASPWRSGYLYLFLFAVFYSLLIRTQAVVLFLAFSAGLLMIRRRKLALAVVAATAICYMPWMIRNMVLGLGQSRYLDQVSFSFVGSKLKMLLVQALPESVVPCFKVDYMQSPSILLWAIAIVMLLLIAYGVWQLRRLRLVMYLFLSGGVGIVAIMDSPSLYRYLIILLPFFTATLVVGLWCICSYLWKMVSRKSLSPWFMSAVLLPGLLQGGDSMFRHSLSDIHEYASGDYPPLFRNSFAMARQAMGMDRDAVVASRKPELLYLVEGLKGVPLINAADDTVAVRYLLECDVDYLIVDGTVPGDNIMKLINGNRNLFTVKSYILEPDMFLFRFEKENAAAWLLGLESQSPKPSR